jgi:hypothetical protein
VVTPSGYSATMALQICWRSAALVGTAIITEVTANNAARMSPPVAIQDGHLVDAAVEVALHDGIVVATR